MYWRAGVYSIPEYLGLRYNQSVRVVTASGPSACSAVPCHGRGHVGVGSGIRNVSGWPIDEYSRIRRGCWLTFITATAAVGFHGRLTGERIMFIRSGPIIVISISELGFTNFAAELTAGGRTQIHRQCTYRQTIRSFTRPGATLCPESSCRRSHWIASQAIFPPTRTLGAKSQSDASAS